MMLLLSKPDTSANIKQKICSKDDHYERAICFTGNARFSRDTPRGWCDMGSSDGRGTFNRATFTKCYHSMSRCVAIKGK